MSKNMSCWSVNSFDFAREKLHERFSAIAVFPAQSRTNYQTNQTCFALITHLLSVWGTTSWKMLMDNKFKAQTSTGTPAWNSHCHVLFSHALNMSCSFGQSVRSIESRCMVMVLYFFVVPYLTVLCHYQTVIILQNAILSNLQYKTHLIKYQYCSSLRCSWSFACWLCSNNIFIIDLTPEYLSSYPGCFWKPHWKSMGLSEISWTTWQVWRYRVSFVCLNSCLIFTLFTSIITILAYVLDSTVASLSVGMIVTKLGMFPFAINNIWTTLLRSNGWQGITGFFSTLMDLKISITLLVSFQFDKNPVQCHSPKPIWVGIDLQNLLCRPSRRQTPQQHFWFLKTSPAA